MYQNKNIINQARNLDFPEKILYRSSDQFLNIKFCNKLWRNSSCFTLGPKPRIRHLGPTTRNGQTNRKYDNLRCCTWHKVIIFKLKSDNKIRIDWFLIFIFLGRKSFHFSSNGPSSLPVANMFLKKKMF